MRLARIRLLTAGECGGKGAARNPSDNRKVRTLANPELGSKQVCPNCQAKFYDLSRRPAHCPKCDTEFDPEEAVKARRGRGRGPFADETEEDQVKDKPAADEDEDEEVTAPEIDQGGDEPILTPDDDDEDDAGDDAGINVSDGDDDVGDDDDDSVPFLEDEDDDSIDEEITKGAKKDDD